MQPARHTPSAARCRLSAPSGAAILLGAFAGLRAAEACGPRVEDLDFMRGILHPAAWALERAIRTARAKVDGLPAGFRYHDLRHYFASLLIASGADVKAV